MKSFCSFLIANPKHSALVESTCLPEDWSIRLQPDPSRRFWFDEYASRTISHPSALGDQKPNESQGRLFVVAGDEPLANNIIQLICASHDIIEGNPGERIGYRSAYEIPADSSDQNSLYRYVFQTSGYFEQFVHRTELPVALRVAATAWSDKSLVYAIHKLSQSFAAESVTWWSCHPRYGQAFEKSTELHSAHVGTSIAINLAFSAIEELRLQVKSDAKKQRWLNNKTGEWNPLVLEDIEQRLRTAGIDPGQTLTWTLRGAESISEAAIRPRLGSPTQYTDGQTVRDIELTLPEALHVCSYVRNFMTAHRFSEQSTYLGPYEVHNIQSVARRLILSQCGMWNVWTDDLLRQLQDEPQPM